MKKDADKKTIIGQIGLGNWGQNLLKNFYLLPDCKLKYACDFDRSKTEKFSKIYPDVIFTDNYDEILEDKEVSAIVVAIPAVDHYSVAKKVLERNKHVFIEKPITLKFSEAQELVELAQKVNKKMYRGALRSILSELIRADRFLVVDSFEVTSPNTKELLKKLDALNLGNNVLIITEVVDENVYLSARNLPSVNVRDVAAMDPVSLVGAEKVVITVAAIKQLEELLK